jgi:tRNA modification GTPase TrmE
VNDTIAAVSTALGVGAIAIVRLSGVDSIKIVNKVFSGKNLEKVQSHTINYGHIVENGNIIDEVLVAVMHAPKTATMENVVEINCHGGIATTNKILELILLNGARLAEPGEFTKRAFLNGRINLVEAEAIMDLVNSKTEDARKFSINHATGKFSEIIRNFRQNLLELLANIEVNIDYPEYEDIEVVTIEDIKSQVKNMRKSLQKIVKESENGRLIKNGIKVALVGRPNVGKSSLLNRMLEEEKAIVTDIAGTTRDTVEGSMMLDGILVNLVDTAGIRETNDIVEKFGVDKSIKEMEIADLVILILNNNETLNEDDLILLNKVKAYKYIIVINKDDLDKNINLEVFDNEHIIYTNTNSYKGIESLKNKIVELFKLDEIKEKDYNYFANVRQISLAKDALMTLNDVEKGIEQEVPVDMIGIDIKKIWNILGDILGESYEEELIDQLFSQFCLGK